MKYIIDSFAWIEYFDGSNIGNVVKDYIESDDDLYSLNLTISEVVSRFKRKNLDPESPYKAIISLSKVLDITPIIAKKAGLLHAELKKKYHNIELVDSLILILARDINAKIVTGDEHFRSFKEAILIK